MSKLLLTIFTEAEITEVKEFIEVNEYGIALEILCSIINEENKVIINKIYVLITKLSN
ncbi:MAG: MafI family immunity protein [Deltaproteobacteria bacterium]|nr:MafI family immunity protein [Deltaproteobacteria bacterium]